MRALLDVNVLVALLDSDHSLHATAMTWFAKHAHIGWATCPITQNGCLRIMSHSSYTNPVSISLVAERLQAATSNAVHKFWADDISALDPTAIDLSRVHGPKQLTDVYLLALAVHHKGRLVTFDRGLTCGAVLNARTHHLLKL
jgi:uncharacterized protein